MLILGKRIYIRELKLEDVYQMPSWGVHKTPLLSDYNYPFTTDEDARWWYRVKTKGIRDSYYAVMKKGYIIGFIGIKQKNPITRSAVLGIVFNPDLLNEGYGTEAMELLLPYYFKEMKMRTLYLEVQEFNHRAFKLYEKLGFKKVAYYPDLFPVQHIDRTHEDFIKEESSFVIYKEKIYNYIYKMKLKKKDFERRRGNEL